MPQQQGREVTLSTVGPARLAGALAVSLATALATSLVFALVVRAAAHRVSRGASPRLDEALTLVCAVAALAIAVWFVGAIVLSVLASLPGWVGRLARRSADRLAPSTARRVAAVLTGAVLAGSVLPAHAVDGSAGRSGPTTSRAQVGATLPFPGWVGSRAADAPRAGNQAAPGPDPASGGPATGHPPLPGWVPDRPVVRAQPDPRLMGAGRDVVDAEGEVDVVVRRGDTLWGLVHRHLGAGATEAEVAAVWPRWYAANRAVIGADPDLLLPGQVLRVPDLQEAR